jgi:catechol 2,3-dioxygenase-like lactoylglutathione lyase family enzyme
MIGHVKLHVGDAARSNAFYEAALEPLGYRVVMEPVPGVVVGMGTRLPGFRLGRVRARPGLQRGCTTTFS